jgi:hypothetical protein
MAWSIPIIDFGNTNLLVGGSLADVSRKMGKHLSRPV